MAGQRVYGQLKDATVVEAEAVIIKEFCQRILDGEGSMKLPTTSMTAGSLRLRGHNGAPARSSASPGLRDFDNVSAVAALGFWPKAFRVSLPLSRMKMATCP